MSAKALAVIVGAGPGTGGAVCKAFAKKGYNVALLSRNADNLKSLTEEVKSIGVSAAPFSCDVSSSASVSQAFADIKKTFPSEALKVAVFNSSSGFHMAPFLETKVSDLEAALSTSAVGAFNFAHAVLPEMLAHKTGGSLIFTGATAALRGSAKLGTFAAGKFALRALTQSLAREFHPQDIHVAHVIIDGMIDTARVAKMVGDTKGEGTRISPDSIAAAYVYLSEQDKSAWTQELDLRPAQEKF